MIFKKSLNLFRQRVRFNFFSEEVRQNPYPFYQHLRQHAPVYYFPKDKCWVLSRYEDVSRALKQPEIYSSKGIVPFENETLIGADPPDHTRVRKIVMPGFTARRMAQLETFIREQTNQLIDQFIDNTTVDFVAALANPLPIQVIVEILGIDPSNMERYIRWSDAASSARIASISPEDIESRMVEFEMFFKAYIAQCQKSPNESIFNDILFDENGRIRFSFEEAVNLGKLLMVGGNETTTNLLANAMQTLLQHPREMRLLKENPTLIPQMIEEVLRFESPTQFVQRRTTQAITINGVTIPADAPIFLLIASANRDEDIFPDPDVFSVQRNTRKHIAFGAGPHYCLGLHLARLEARIVFEGLFSRNIDFQQIGNRPSAQLDTVQLRGLKELTIRIKPFRGLKNGNSQN